MEEELRLEKDVWLPIMQLQLTLGLADEIGEQDSKLETLVSHFTKLEGTVCLELSSELVTKPALGTKRKISWESEESKAKDVAVIDSETEEMPPDL